MDEPLPTLHQGDLDEAQVERLFAELADHATIDGVSAKGAPAAYTRGESLTLVEAAALVRSRQVHGVQIRYRYGGTAWFDTLLVRTTGVRVVRIAAPA